MQKYSMSNKASIMSVLTLIISLVVIGLVSTGCGGGGGPATYTLSGTAVQPGTSTPNLNTYTVNVDNGLATGSSVAGHITAAVPSTIITSNGATITLTFTDAGGNLVGTQTVTVTGANLSGNTINLGNVPVGPPTSPV